MNQILISEKVYVTPELKRKKRILEDENLIRRTKEEINKEIAELEEKYEEAEEVLESLK